MAYDTIDHISAVGYMKWMLEYLKAQDQEPDSILDIGAAHGHFSKLASEVFPNARIHCVECNERDHYFLDDKPWDVTFACLGEECGEQTFYIDPNSEVGGGSSLYREKTDSFDEVLEETVSIKRLDDLGLGEFDFIKIDTQGSEVDIMRGGRTTFEAAKYVTVEMSFVKYNEGGCLIDDVIAELRSMGFRLWATTGPMKGLHWHNYQPVQIDGLFVKEDIPVFEVL